MALGGPASKLRCMIVEGLLSDSESENCDFKMLRMSFVGFFVVFMGFEGQSSS